MAEHTTSGGGIDRVVHRTIQGRDAVVHADPEEIRVEWGVGRPIYFGVRVGDRIKDADRDVSSPLIDEWSVTEIAPDRVVGVGVDTGERREWDRETLERALAIGNYATNLSAFERVAAHRVGSAPGNQSNLPHAPYVTVIAYGNNGERYGRRYRFVDDDERQVTVRDEDAVIGRLPADLRAMLDDRIREILGEDGYELVAIDDEPETDEE